jgi:hypothetical protein
MPGLASRINPHLIRGHSRSGVPIMAFLDLVEPVTGESDLVIQCRDDEVPAPKRGRRPQPNQMEA